VLGTLVAALSFAAVAYADQIDEDADLVAAGNQASRDLGTVAPGAILTPPVSFELQCNGNRHVNSGQSVNLTFSLSGSTVPGGNLSATNTTIGPIPASWPDDGTNCPSPAPAPIPDNGNSVVTITAPATPGSYTFIVKWDKSVSPPDVTGSGPSVAFDLTVEAPNEPPTVDAGGPYNGSEGSAVSLDGTATDPDGDPVTTSWSYAAVTADSGATCDFGDAGAADTTVTCTDDGTFTLTLTADDGVNDPVSDSTTLTLSNADPSATPSIPAGDVNEGDSFSLSLSSPSDPGANDTFTYQFDCGDGGGYNAASSTASRTCPTTDNGSRAVKLKILDDDGGFAEYTGT
jgi:hypothetical protein